MIITRAALAIACGLGLLAMPLAEAQPKTRMPTVGFLLNGSAQSPSPVVEAVTQGLRDLGWIAGQNVTLEYRYADGKAERFPELAGELARVPVDVIVAPPAAATLAAKAAPTTIPIALTPGADPG